MWFWVIAYLVAALFFDWWPFVGNTLSLRQTEPTYGVFFYTPRNEQEMYLGSVVGLDACRSTARSKAFAMKMQNANWSYICCKQTRSSSCEVKER